MSSVKTAISLPEDLFAEVEVLAAERHVSRSAVVAQALREYVERLDTARLMAEMNAVHGGMPDPEWEADRAAWRKRYAERVGRHEW